MFEQTVTDGLFRYDGDALGGMVQENPGKSKTYILLRNPGGSLILPVIPVATFYSVEKSMLFTSQVSDTTQQGGRVGSEKLYQCPPSGAPDGVKDFLLAGKSLQRPYHNRAVWIYSFPPHSPLSLFLVPLAA